MAIPLIALGAYELGTLAVMGIAAAYTAINPPKIPDIPWPEGEGKTEDKPAKKTSGDIVKEVDKVKMKDKSLERTKESCKKCPPPGCVPPVGGKCLVFHWHAEGRKTHKPCIDPQGGHVHVLLSMRSPYPDCKCFFQKAYTACVPGGIFRPELLRALGNYSLCPSEIEVE